VGSLRPWHGIDTIARAWELMGSEAPPLLVIGDGPSRGLLEMTGARLTGAVPPGHVPELLSEAEIGLAPYGRDAPRYFSPIKLFEYLAAGLATVVADLPAVTNVVDDGCAAIIPAGDADALAAAVARLGADPRERRRLGDNGRRLVADRHTWRHRARSILEHVSDLAAAPAGA
jgi:glycosyltransferase involved in cell wall biosynthesis